MDGIARIDGSAVTKIPEPIYDVAIAYGGVFPKDNLVLKGQGVHTVYPVIGAAADGIGVGTSPPTGLSATQTITLWGAILVEGKAVA